MPSLSHITNQMLFAGATGNSFHFVKGNYKEILKLKMFGQDTEGAEMTNLQFVQLVKGHNRTRINMSSIC